MHILRSDRLVGVWDVPLKGIIRNMPITSIPSDALYDARNVIVKAGRLQPRSGLALFANTVLTGRATGTFNTMTLASAAFQLDAFQNDAFQVLGTIPTTSLLVGTTKKLYTFFGGVFNDVTGPEGDLTALDAHLARFTSIQLGTPPTLYAIHTNGNDAPRVWDATSGLFNLVAGSPPNFTDVCTISDHVLGIVPPYVVRWSNTKDIGVWPANNSRIVSDTADPVVAIRNFGTQGGVLYKSRSIWNVEVVGDTEASYFRIVLKGLFDGPCSPAAVVEADGANYYMTDTGRVGYFDGSTFEWVADGVWPIVEAELDTAHANRVFGVFYPRLRQVWFVYPRTGESGDGTGLCIVQLPKPWEGINTHIAWHGRLGFAVSTGADLRLDLKDSILISVGTRQVYRVTENVDDAGTPISGFWQPGLVMAPGGDIFALDAYETFVLRGEGYGFLTVRPVYSFILDSEGGTLGAAKLIDLAAVNVTDPKGGNLRGRFFGLRYEFTTPVTLRWAGARLAASPRAG